MVNDKTPSDDGAWMNFNTGKKAGNGGDKAASKLPAMHPQDMGKAMHEHCMETRVQ
jgi:hypothetical protein